jgi:hypothetical protein
LGEKIGYLPLEGQSDLMSNDDRIRFVVYRKREDKNIQFDAQPGTMLAPGDVVEVALTRRSPSATKSVQINPDETPTR